MAGTFSLQIVTPEREVFDSPVESVSLPGSDGGFGVLRNHAPLIAALDAGEVTLFDAESRPLHLAVGGGFFQVIANQAIILADSAETAAEINLERARAAESRARARLAGQMETEGNFQRDRADAALKRAIVRQKVAARK
jgi:F-type H+-transporting ATPase subunit epsilon